MNFRFPFGGKNKYHKPRTSRTPYRRRPTLDTLESRLMLAADSLVLGMVFRDLNTNGVQRGTAIESYRSMSAYQCSVVELYDQFSLKLVPSSGGPTAWLKLSGSDYQSRLFQPGQRASVSIDANASDQDNYLYAWPQEEC